MADSPGGLYRTTTEDQISSATKSFAGQTASFRNVSSAVTTSNRITNQVYKEVRNNTALLNSINLNMIGLKNGIANLSYHLSRQTSNKPDTIGSQKRENGRGITEYLIPVAAGVIAALGLSSTTTNAKDDKPPPESSGSTASPDVKKSDVPSDVKKSDTTGQSIPAPEGRTEAPAAAPVKSQPAQSLQTPASKAPDAEKVQQAPAVPAPASPSVPPIAATPLPPLKEAKSEKPAPVQGPHTPGSPWNKDRIEGKDIPPPAEKPVPLPPVRPPEEKNEPVKKDKAAGDSNLVRMNKRTYVGKPEFISASDILSYLMGKTDRVHAIGIIANMERESSFSPNVLGDDKTSGGLFQHHLDRFKAMKDYVGPNWTSDWKKQIDYAFNEKQMNDYLAKKFKNSEAAASEFVDIFERPKDGTKAKSGAIANAKKYDKSSDAGDTLNDRSMNTEANRTAMANRPIVLPVPSQRGTQMTANRGSGSGRSGRSNPLFAGEIIGHLFGLDDHQAA